MTDANEIWNIDASAMFANYENFHLRHKDDIIQQPFGGLAWGRPLKREITQVLFLVAEDMTSEIAEFLRSIMSADLQLVANLTVDSFVTPLVSFDRPILQLSTTEKILQQADMGGFMNQNRQLKAIQFTNQGLSLYSRVGIQFNLRVGVEADDLKAEAERYFDDLDRIVFINQEKSLILSRKPENEAVAKILDEHSKGAVHYKDSIKFTAYHSLTKSIENDSERPKAVPIARITRDGTEYVVYSAVFTVVTPVFPGENSNRIYERLQEALRRRIELIVRMNLPRIEKRQKLVKTTSAVFYPPGWSTLIHLQVPDLPNDEQKSFRLRLHELLNLSVFTPCLRLSQQIPFEGASKLLRTPHLSITGYKALGKISVVKGPYNYHHYMQDKVDDNGWGCAYRSLQTIWSWFVLNGFTDKPVPSHREIQKCLVKIGDKEEKFIGSRQWIGSTEIGFVLNELLGVDSKFITAGSGAKVTEKARKLAHHFETAGSPVMIGGGQLAHTLLGVDFDKNTGDCRFLVLDPHYSGSEDIRTVTSKGWCQWKPASFWKTEFFYNMLCPQPPEEAI